MHVHNKSLFDLDWSLALNLTIHWYTDSSLLHWWFQKEPIVWRQYHSPKNKLTLYCWDDSREQTIWPGWLLFQPVILFWPAIEQGFEWFKLSNSGQTLNDRLITNYFVISRIVFELQLRLRLKCSKLLLWYFEPEASALMSEGFLGLWEFRLKQWSKVFYILHLGIFEKYWSIAVVQHRKVSDHKCNAKISITDFILLDHSNFKVFSWRSWESTEPNEQ